MPFRGKTCQMGRGKERNVKEKECICRSMKDMKKKDSGV
jgi:hypothetical protein